MMYRVYNDNEEVVSDKIDSLDHAKRITDDFKKKYPTEKFFVEAYRTVWSSETMDSLMKEIEERSFDVV